MDEIHFNSIQQFNDYYGFETLHPLVSVVRYDKQLPIEDNVSLCTGSTRHITSQILVISPIIHQPSLSCAWCIFGL